jgi:hypothetical protein
MDLCIKRIKTEIMYDIAGKLNFLMCNGVIPDRTAWSETIAMPSLLSCRFV